MADFSRRYATMIIGLYAIPALKGPPKVMRRHYVTKQLKTQSSPPTTAAHIRQNPAMQVVINPIGVSMRKVSGLVRLSHRRDDL